MSKDMESIRKQMIEEIKNAAIQIYASAEAYCSGPKIPKEIDIWIKARQLDVVSINLDVDYYPVVCDYDLAEKVIDDMRGYSTDEDDDYVGADDVISNFMNSDNVPEGIDGNADDIWVSYDDVFEKGEDSADNT